MAPRWARSLAGVGGLVVGSAALGGCGGGAATRATTGAGATRAGPVLIVRRFDGSVSYDGRRPSTIGLSGDASNIVGQLTWRNWGPAGAVGRGTLRLDDCKPDCARGAVTTVPAVLRLGDVRHGHFTTMTEQTGGVVRHFRYPSDWAASAS